MSDMSLVASLARFGMVAAAALVLVGLSCDGASKADPHGATGGAAEAGETGTPIGDVRHTYYYLADESKYSAVADTTLYDGKCRPLAHVSRAFSDSICIEGSGKLKDGTVLNFHSGCKCGATCPTGGVACYEKIDPASFPWGKGSKNNALVPFRSIATDPKVLPYGTIVYLPSWRGLTFPAVGGAESFVHDGCFRADDVGGAIKGHRIDVFVGTADAWKTLEALRPSKTSQPAFRDAPACAGAFE